MKNNSLKKAARAAAFALAFFLLQNAAAADSLFLTGKGSMEAFAASYLEGGPDGNRNLSESAYEDMVRQDSEVSMEASYGFDNAAKGNRTLPVHVSMKELKGSSFQGFIRIKLMESDYEIYQYEYPVSLKASESAVSDYYIPIGVRTDQIYVTLSDSQEKELVRRRMKINMNMDMPELFIGVLSDTPERLQYMDNIGLNYSALTTRTFPLSQETLPEMEEGLEQLDVLLISNYDTGRLSEGQIGAVKEWIYDGGYLILGAGERGRETFSAFASEILDEPLGEAELTQLDMDGEYGAKGARESVEVPFMEIPLTDGVTCLTSSETTVISAVAAKKGTIAAAAYDFTDMEEFCQQNPAYIEKKFHSIIGEEEINNMAFGTYGSSSKFYSVQSVINTGSIERLPQVKLYVVVIISYVLLVGPGLYFFFKHRNLAGIYRSGATALAVVCTGIIYLMGMKTRFYSEFYTYATILDVVPEGARETTYMNVRMPYNKPYTVSLKPEYRVLPLTKNSYYEVQQVPRFTGEESSQISLKLNEDATDVFIQNVAAFTPKYFELTKFAQPGSRKGFTGTVHSFENTLSGSITNSTGRDVEDAAVILFGRMALLGDMAAGETKDLSQIPLKFYPLNTYVVAEAISGADRFETADIDNKEYVVSLERTRLLNFYLSDTVSGFQPGARVVAFFKEDSQEFLRETPEEVSGFSMVTSAVELDNTKDGMVYRSALSRAPEAQGGNYFYSSNTMYGITPVILEYYLGNDLEVENIVLEEMDRQFQENPRYEYLTPFTGNLYFYNYDKGSYDKMPVSKKKYTKQELESYLSPGNTITVKYSYDNASENSWNILLPMIMVTGREK